MCVEVFCDACKEKHGVMARITGLLPVRVASYMLMPYTLPVESAYSAVQRSVSLLPITSFLLAHQAQNSHSLILILIAMATATNHKHSNGLFD